MGKTEKTYSVHILGNGGQHEISIDALAEDELKDKNILGVAYGIDIGHCFYLGARHGEKFIDRVKFYHVHTDSDDSLEELRVRQPSSIKISFYGDKLHE